MRRFVGLVAVSLVACSEPPVEITKERPPTNAGADAGTDGGTACDCPDTDRGRTVSGSRLRAQYIYAEDGSRQFTGWWHDTKTGEDCRFFDGTAKVDPGEVIRCIPYPGPTLPIEEYAEATLKFED